MKKQLLSLVLVLLVFSLNSYAVLKEKDVNTTVSMLRAELEDFANLKQEDINKFDKQRQFYRDELTSTYRYSEILALALYSQQPNYTLSIMHACREMRVVYEDFMDRQFPFSRWREEFDSELVRYKGLKNVLLNINDEELSSQGIIDKRKSLEICDYFIESLNNREAKLTSDRVHYEKLSTRLENLEKYTDIKFGEIRGMIYGRGSGSYMQVITDFGSKWETFKNSVYEMYFTGQNANSDWKDKMLLFTIGCILLLAVTMALSYCIIRWLLPINFKRRYLQGKDRYYGMAIGMLLFAIFIVVASRIFFKRSFFLTASDLVIEYAWLIGAIFLSLSIRLTKKSIKHAMLQYSPLIFMGGILMIYRILLVSKDIIQFTLVPLLVLTLCLTIYYSIWLKSKLKRLDKFLLWTTAITTVVDLALAWAGMAILSIQIMMLTVIFVAVILSIDCLDYYFPKKKLWQRRLFNLLLYPLLLIIAVEGSLLWTAHIFDMESWAENIFVTPFLDMKGIARLSFYNLTIVAILCIITNYVVLTMRQIIKTLYGEKAKSGSFALCVNIGTIIVWGGYVLTAMLILSMDQTSLLTAVGGMSVGIGFALKDTLTNLFYGISLMLGRVRIGDVVECDGIRGKIANIDYQSTLIETVDGSIIAFLNSQLFAKNFKNLTRNHGFELSKITIGVAYGTDIAIAKQLILSAADDCDFIEENRKPGVYLNDFGDNSVNLVISVWVPVIARAKSLSELKEKIYNKFNENGVTIPFPQHDVYIHTMPEIKTVK